MLNIIPAQVQKVVNVVNVVNAVLRFRAFADEFALICFSVIFDWLFPIGCFTVFVLGGIVIILLAGKIIINFLLK